MQTDMQTLTQLPTLPPALSALVSSLPPAGTALQLEQRQRFMTALDAVLAWLYPERDPAQPDLFG